jgi:hypothetical protein
MPNPFNGVTVTVDVLTTHTKSESLTSQAILPSMYSSMDSDGQLQGKSLELV